MRNDLHLPPSDFLFDTGVTLQEMRLLVEGAILLYTDETSDLFLLAREHDQYAMAESFSTIGCALYNLRDLIHNLQNGYIEETKRQLAAESP